MAGAYVVGAKYETDNATILPIRVQPETIAASIGSANSSPAGTVAGGLGSARVGGGNRQAGVKARSVTFRFTGTTPTAYEDGQVLRIPILQKSVWDAISKGTTGTYLSTAIVVVGKQPERTN